jgi:hypothetical protein
MTPTHPRRAWEKPEIRRLRAGAADFTSGAQLDGAPGNS